MCGAATQTQVSDWLRVLLSMNVCVETERKRERGWCMKCGEESSLQPFEVGGGWRGWEHRLKTTWSRVWCKAQISKCAIIYGKRKTNIFEFFPVELTLSLSVCSTGAGYIIYKCILRTFTLFTDFNYRKCTRYSVTHLNLVQAYVSGLSLTPQLHKGQLRWTSVKTN